MRHNILWFFSIIALFNLFPSFHLPPQFSHTPNTTCAVPFKVTTSLLLLIRSVMSDSFVTLWTVAHQSPLSMGFPKQEYWNRLPFPTPRHLKLISGGVQIQLQSPAHLTAVPFWWTPRWDFCGYMERCLRGRRDSPEMKQSSNCLFLTGQVVSFILLFFLNFFLCSNFFIDV